MSLSPLIQCFKDDYDRFAGLMEQQIAMCPPEVWTATAGGWPFWQQIFHTVMCTEIFALREDAPSAQQRFDREVVLLSKVPEDSLSKEEVLALSARMKEVAHAFFASLAPEDLDKEFPRLSRILGRPTSYQSALMALVRHCCYHLGCCDAVLRDNGLKGVY